MCMSSPDLGGGGGKQPLHDITQLWLTKREEQYETLRILEAYVNVKIPAWFFGFYLELY